MTSAALEAVLSEFSTLVKPASRLERPAAPTVRCGIAPIDELTGGLPRGCLTEICGPASSGRTSLVLSALAEATARGEVCALVDASDCFDPLSAQQAGVDLERLLWVRCNFEFRISNFEKPKHGFRRIITDQSEQNPPQRHRGTEENFEFRISNFALTPVAHSERREQQMRDASEKTARGQQPAAARKKEKEARFINSGMKNCGSKGVHTQIFSGMPAIPEVNVLTRPEQRYRDITKLKQGDYREVWQSDQPPIGDDVAAKIPPGREHSAFGIQHSEKSNHGSARIHTERAEETARHGSTRMSADSEKIESSVHRLIGSSQERTSAKSESKSEVRNRKSEFQSGDWLFHSGRTVSPAMRAQCSRIEQALKVTDLLLQSGGFGLIALDLGNISTRAARRVPLTSWFRFRRAVENTPTVLLVLEREAHARSCASLVLQLSVTSTQQSTKTNHGFARIDTDKRNETVRRGSTRMNTDLFSEHSAIGIQHSEEQHAPSSMPYAAEPPSHAELLTGIDSCAEIARGERKGVASVRAEFTSESAWSA